MISGGVHRRNNINGWHRINIAGKHHVLGLERKSLSYSDPEALWTKIKNLTALFSHKRELYASKEVKENAVASEGKLPC